LALQFGNSHVESFDLVEGDQVYFTQKFDDPGLVRVHATHYRQQITRAATFAWDVTVHLTSATLCYQ
jgi:hypothetical protein